MNGMLTGFQVGGGNTEEYEIHLKGINEMVKLRGGLENLGMRGMVRNCKLSRNILLKHY